MKISKILFSFISALICCSVSYAASWPQMYIGVQGGLANTNFSISNVKLNQANGGGPVTSANISNHISAIRGYAGYRWNEYLALEGGYLKPRSTRFQNINGGGFDTGWINQYAIDVTGKLFLPMATYIHLSPYLKAGGAYMSSSTGGSIVRNGASNFGYSLHPLLGVGIGYNFTPYLVGDISWTNITKYNSNIPQTNLFFAGLTYYFSVAETKSNSPNFGDMTNDDS
ncbi:MAG TPA: porin family protein [Gammaproteobacteria bacterium]|nr:porin family protein [Gammaproteobacteria bacterium]